LPEQGSQALRVLGDRLVGEDLDTGSEREVSKICVAQGMQACNLGVPILEEELAARGAAARD
jgi:hypothetical protein